MSRDVCQAKVKPQPWRAGTMNRCHFKASVTLPDGKRVCQIHARKSVGPTWTEVLAFLVKERDSNSLLWNEILVVYKNTVKP